PCTRSFRSMADVGVYLPDIVGDKAPGSDDVTRKLLDVENARRDARAGRRAGEGAVLLGTAGPRIIAGYQRDPTKPRIPTCTQVPRCPRKTTVVSKDTGHFTCIRRPGEIHNSYTSYVCSEYLIRGGRK